ncbi:MAG: RNA methyltransferase [Planctomycetota bacterium]
MDDPEPPFRLRRAEAVLRRRTSRLVLVMERPWNDDNVQAVLRTAESFGIQHVWTIKHPQVRQRAHRSVTKGSHLWITRRIFPDIEACLAATRDEGFALWATDLSDGAEAVTGPEVLEPFPERVALVIGRELQGVAPEILAAADRRLYLPMSGFTESFNLSVATALLVQRCFDAEPELVGAMDEGERQELRRAWYERLAGSNAAKRDYYARLAETPPEPNDGTRPAADARQPRLKKKYLGKRGWV